MRFAIMAIDPIRYLVSPRILAVALVLPCLTLFADMVGVLGGCLVATFSLDITPTAYFSQAKKVLEVSDVAKGLIKSFVFGIEIALIGCLRGFQVRGGAESVGQATTSAVVTSIFVSDSHGRGFCSPVPLRADTLGRVRVTKGATPEVKNGNHSGPITFSYDRRPLVKRQGAPAPVNQRMR